MVELGFFMGSSPYWIQTSRVAQEQKTDVADHPKAFHHVGLLANEPPGRAGLPFI
jgi:hypothetical protein